MYLFTWIYFEADGTMASCAPWRSIIQAWRHLISSSSNWWLYYQLGQQGGGVFKVIEKSVFAFHAFHFYFLKHLPETQEPQFLVFLLSAWYPEFDHLPSKQMLRRQPQVVCINEVALTLILINGDQPEPFELFKHRIVNESNAKSAYGSVWRRHTVALASMYCYCACLEKKNKNLQVSEHSWDVTSYSEDMKPFVKKSIL